MPQTLKSPTNLDEWLAFFSDKPLPVRASTIVRLRKALDSPSSNLLSLTPIIRTDPLMVFQVARAAQAMLTPKSAKVASIDHAVQTLGFDRIEQLLKSLNGFKLNPHSTVHTMFMRAVADSHHAATQAAEFACLKHRTQVEEIKLASLLYGSIHWFAWLYAPLHKEAYQRKVLLEGVDVALAEFDVFGCTLQSVGHKLAQKLNLPELTVTALSHDTSPSSDLLSKLHMKAMGDHRLQTEQLREINHFFQQPFFPVKLSNWLALTATRGWNTPKAKRLYEIISDYLVADKDVTLSRLHSHCAQSAREYQQPGVLSPAAEMLLLPSNTKAVTFIGKISDKERQRLTQEAPPVVVEVSSPAKIKRTDANPKGQPNQLQSDFKDKTLFDSVKTELQSLATDKHYLKIAYILKQLHKGLTEGLGFNRVIVFQVGKKEAKLKPIFSSGFNPDDPLKSYIQDLKIPSIFKLAATKSTFVWFSDKSSAKLMPLIPAQFENIMPNNDWLLTSLFDTQGPLVMLYADHGHHAPPLNSFMVEQFRVLANLTNQAFKNLPQESS